MAFKSTLARIAEFIEQGERIPDALFRTAKVGYNTGAAARQWEDLRFPATAINPPGQVSDPTWDNTNGGWLFASGGTEQLWIVAQLPHAWAEGRPLSPHFHWEKSTSAAGTVLWRMTYTWSKLHTARTAEVSIESNTPVQSIDIADTQMITSVADIDTTGYPISSMIIAKIARIGGSDTYGADARLLEFDIHYEVDSFGSNQEFIK